MPTKRRTADAVNVDRSNPSHSRRSANSVKKDSASTPSGESRIIELLRPYLVEDEPNADGEYRGHCPIHPDENPDASFNPGKGVWKCFSRPDDGGSLDRLLPLLTARHESGFVPAWVGANGSRSRSHSSGHQEPIGDLEVLRMHRTLLDSSGALPWLMEHRGLSIETIERFKLGYHPGKRRFSIPVYDEARNLVNVRYYKPKAKRNKVIGVDGRNGARLYPVEVLDDADTVVFVEGELDALLLIQHGIPAITHTGGAGLRGWHADWTEALAGKRVLTCTDRDNPGLLLAQTVDENLRHAAREVAPIKLPYEVKDDHGDDVTDYLVRDGHSLDEFRALIPEPDPAADGLVTEVKRALGELAAEDATADHFAALHSEDDVLRLPDIEWHVDGFFPAHGASGIYGQPGVGKTLLIIDLAECTRRGSKWHGRDTRRGAVLFYEGEGLHEFKPRLTAYNAKHPLKDGETKAPVGFVDAVVDLTSPESVAAIIRTARRFERETGERVRLVVVEPLIENMTGDENGDGMDLASRGLRVIANFLECSVIVGHHTNASGERARGNDKLRARLHALFRMERATNNVVGLVCEKQRSGPWLTLELVMVDAPPSVVFAATQEMSAEEYVKQRDERIQAATEAKKAARRDRTNDTERERVLAVIRDNPGITKSGVEKEFTGKGIGKARIAALIQSLTAGSEAPVHVEYGANRSERHYATGEPS